MVDGFLIGIRIEMCHYGFTPSQLSYILHICTIQCDICMTSTGLTDLFLDLKIAVIEVSIWFTVRFTNMHIPLPSSLRS